MVQAKQESRSLEISRSKADRDFILATKTRIISESTDNEILDALKVCMLKIGIKSANIPERNELLVLINHIRKNYNRANIGEIVLAWDMAITGRLDLKPEDVKCYENFSCSYFSQIMNAYLNYANQERRKTEVLIPEQKIYTRDQLDNFQREDVETFYQRLRVGWVPDKIPEYFKDILIKDELIKQGESIGEFFGRRLGNGIENIYKRIT